MCTRVIIGFLAVSLVAGCGDSGTPQPEPQSNTPTKPSGVTVDLSGADPLPVPDGGRVSGAAELDDRDPVEKLLDEIQQLHVSTAANRNADPRGAIVLKSTEILKLTMNEPSRQQQFLDGVRHLLQARFQLALDGSKEDIDQLYADAQALNDRDPKSAAAAESIYYLAKFAHAKARRVRQGKAEWNISFSRWAREFASRFPQQAERAVSLLFGAGRSCEMTAATASTKDESALLRSEARLCYVALMERWPKEPQGQEAVAVLRRLELPGRRLSQFSGPGLDGAQVGIDDFQGKVTVIFFWDSGSKAFKEEWLPLLKKADSQLSERPFQLIGVNLDDHPDQCRQAVQDLKVPGTQICFQDETSRGWNSPLVRFWGVSQSPSVWLVDRNGVVDAVDLRRKTLVSRVNQLLRARRTASK